MRNKTKSEQLHLIQITSLVPCLGVTGGAISALHSTWIAGVPPPSYLHACWALAPHEHFIVKEEGFKKKRRLEWKDQKQMVRTNWLSPPPPLFLRSSSSMLAEHLLHLFTDKEHFIVSTGPWLWKHLVLRDQLKTLPTSWIALYWQRQRIVRKYKCWIPAYPKIAFSSWSSNITISLLKRRSDALHSVCIWA